MLVPRLLSAGQNCTQSGDGATSTKPSKHLGTTWIEDLKLPTRIPACFPGCFMGLWARRCPVNQKEPKEMWRSQAGKSHLGEVLQIVQNALTSVLWLMKNRQSQLAKKQQQPSSSPRHCYMISTL